MTQHSSLQAIAPSAADALARLDRVVSDFVDRLGNLGILVAIDVEGLGRMTFTAGHTDLGKSRPVQPGDVFQIGSQTKTIVAMILFLMARDGLLDLDDPVTRYLDIPVDGRISVRHLLMNSSGLGEYTFAFSVSGGDMRNAIAPRDLVSLALPQGQLFEPGERFDYCNTGWVIAAMLIEALTGRSYRDVADERIAKPLGLRASGFGGKIPPNDRMQWYMKVAGAPEPVETSGRVGWAFGAGDGFANADDILAIYSSLMRKDSPLGISLQDLAAETAKPSLRPHVPLSLGTEYGLGLERRAWAGSEVWGHPGSTGGCRTSTWIDVARGVSVTTAATVNLGTSNVGEDVRYPRAQLFSMALNAAYALVDARG
jgi:D-alanyl-D-alanine carboxypeptidase